jgi:hypothetical protein
VRDSFFEQGEKNLRVKKQDDIALGLEIPGKQEFLNPGTCFCCKKAV